MSTIKIADSSDQGRWDAFVISKKDAGPYHLFAWKNAIEFAYHHSAYYLIEEDESNKIRGIFPLVHVKAPALRGTLVSLPFCDYGGVLTSSSNTSAELIQYSIDLAMSLKARLELRYKHPEEALSKSQEFGVLSQKVRMVLNLPEGSDNLWNAFKSKLRSQINRPQKDGLEFKLGSLDLLDDFYTVFRLNMRNLGSPVHSRIWISSVLELFGSSSHVGVVYNENKPVAAGIILEFRDKVSVPWASSLIEYSKLSPNMLLYWGFLRFASDNGFKLFDFGRSTPGEGTYKFKEQWGATPFPLYWYAQDFIDQKEPSLFGGKVRQFIETTWSRLPQAFVDRLGPIIRRYITL
jgi:FemAB-related protein (PEP-CTERM system-associated)